MYLRTQYGGNVVDVHSGEIDCHVNPILPESNKYTQAVVYQQTIFENITFWHLAQNIYFMDLENFFSHQEMGEVDMRTREIDCRVNPYWLLSSPIQTTSHLILGKWFFAEEEKGVEESVVLFQEISPAQQDGSSQEIKI